MRYDNDAYEERSTINDILLRNYNIVICTYTYLRIIKYGNALLGIL